MIAQALQIDFLKKKKIKKLKIKCTNNNRLLISEGKTPDPKHRFSIFGSQ
jgi:hypothetical protein